MNILYHGHRMERKMTARLLEQKRAKRTPNGRNDHQNNPCNHCAPLDMPLPMAEVPRTINATPMIFNVFNESLGKIRGDTMTTHTYDVASSGYSTLRSPNFSAFMNNAAVITRRKNPAINGTLNKIPSTDSAKSSLANLRTICATADNSAATKANIDARMMCMERK